MRSAAHNALTVGVVLLLAGPGCRQRDSGPPEPAPTSADAGVPDAEAQVGPRPVYKLPIRAVPSEFVQLTRAVGQAVVNLRTKGVVTGGPASMYPNARPDSSLGSGVLIDHREGYILTNLHLVERASSIQVVFVGGEERDADLIGSDPHLDIALLQLGGRALPEDIAPAVLGESDHVQVGEWVVALGNPFGGEVTASAGIISSTGGATSIYEPPQARYRGLLHTDADIHRGNTGGPLVNLANEVIGINAAAPRPVGSASALGFAVPASQIMRVFEQLEKGQVVQTWLGIFVVPVTEDNAGRCAPRGVRVNQVVRASPAARAGLRVGDIITRFDSHEVDEPKLAALSRTTQPDQRVVLSICRNGGSLERTLVVEAKPN